MAKTIDEIFDKDDKKSLAQLSKKDKEWLNSRIKERAGRGVGIECIIRGKNSNGDYFELTPEEIIRQHYAHILIDTYGYSKEQLDFETQVTFSGKEKNKEKRVDIVVRNKNDNKKIDLVIEVKRPKIRNEMIIDSSEASSPYEQMKSYCNQLHPKIGVIANGDNLLKFYDMPYYEDELGIDKFPINGEDLDEWKENRRFTIKQLIVNDRLQTELLKDIVLKVEQRFGANEPSEKAFDEILKLIFIKLYDEFLSINDTIRINVGINDYNQKLKDINDADFRTMEFRVKSSDTLDEIQSNFKALFKRAKENWSGVFPKSSTLDMQQSTLKSCVKELQNIRLLNTELEIADEAFEHLTNKIFKSDMGQYFTPRYVIDMCVRMLNPKRDETIIDTACGCCGFLMHTIFYVWGKGNKKIGLIPTTNGNVTDYEYVKDKVFGIDFGANSVKVGRMLNIIAGDGHTNVIELNTLDYPKWEAKYKNDHQWIEKYSEGFVRFCSKSAKQDNFNDDKERFEKFNFDILMANPPFAGKLDNKEQFDFYELGKNKNAVGRDILFIERNINFLKPGGRMAIVLPQGRFNNAKDKYIRDYIADKCRILAVVGLHENTFKPHTNTKTSVLFVQKWTDEECGFPNICPKPLDENGEIDYPIFFATMQEPSKDNSGNKIYVSEDYVRNTIYSYETQIVYVNKKTKSIITQKDYDVLEDQKGYTPKYQTSAKPKYITDDDGNKLIIKDIFTAKYGEINSHKKWILKNLNFIKKDDKNRDMISIERFLELDEYDRAEYKAVPIVGENTKPLIGIDEYETLDKATKKYYLVAEEITESTERIKDTHGRVIVKHDLFNHDPNMANPNPNNLYSKDGITEAFIEFAKQQNLSFWSDNE